MLQKRNYRNFLLLDKKNLPDMVFFYTLYVVTQDMDNTLEGKPLVFFYTLYVVT